MEERQHANEENHQSFSKFGIVGMQHCELDNSTVAKLFP